MSDASRRGLILQVAARLLTHYGPQKTTVADVAREAGVGVGTVYLEFPSKEAIVLELSRMRHAAVLDAMRAAAGLSGRSFGERLVGALDARLAAYLAEAGGGAHACDLFHCAANAAVKAASDRFHEDERALVASILREGTAAGELDVADPDLGARAILRAYGSFTPPWIFMSEQREIMLLVSTVHAIVLRGVVKREPLEKSGGT